MTATLLRALLLGLAVAALGIAPLGMPAPGAGAALAGDDGGGDDGGSGSGGRGGDDDDDGDGDDDADRGERTGERAGGRAPGGGAVPVPAAAVAAAAAADEIVTFGLSPAARAAALDRGFRVIEARRLAALGVETLRLAPPPGMSLAAAQAALAALDPAAAVDLNHFYRPGAAGPAAAACAGPHCAARALANWPAVGPDCDPGGMIGMIDAGIDAGHPAFAPGRLEVIRLDPADRGAPSGTGHGSAVASILAGDAAGPAPGLLPAARIVAVDAFHRAGGEERADAFALATALDLLSARGVAAVNLSLAGPDNAILARVVAALDRRGIVLVAAVGNAGPGAPPAYPAGYPAVIAVTAIEVSGRLWRRAVRGPHVDLAAPGVGIWAAAPGGGRAHTGTSFAAPFVTAAAYVLRMQGLDRQGIEAALAAAARDAGPPGHDPGFGFGILDAGAICAAARGEPG
jgi:hypothetical protein